MTSSKLDSQSNLTTKEIKEIENIIKGIGSPYGEGATYDPLDTETGRGPTHLDEQDAALLLKDLESLLFQKKAEWQREAKKQGTFEAYAIFLKAIKEAKNKFQKRR